MLLRLKTSELVGGGGGGGVKRAVKSLGKVRLIQLGLLEFRTLQLVIETKKALFSFVAECTTYIKAVTKFT